MTVDEVRALHEAMPPGTAISLPREVLGALLDGLSPPGGGGRDVDDLTLQEAVERVGRALSTVRGWCSGGLLVGAYKLNGRDWRIPTAALDAFLRAQEERRARPPRGASAGSDLSAWRSEYGGKAPPEPSNKE